MSKSEKLSNTSSPAISSIPASPQTLAKLISAYQTYMTTLGKTDPASQQPSPAAQIKMSTMPESHLQKALESIQNATSWFGKAKDGKEETLSKRHLKRALDHFGLSMSDEFYKTIEDDTLVEIYSENMVQLYRNLAFLDMTGYSILDLSVFEWYVLWERAPYATTQLFERAQTVLTKKPAFMSMDVAPHALNESFNAGMTEPFTPRKSELSMKHIGFLSPTRPDAPVAFACTSTARILSYGESESDNLILLK